MIDILAIPILIMASESAFNASSRVIDPYKSSLAPEILNMLMWEGD